MEPLPHAKNNIKCWGYSIMKDFKRNLFLWFVYITIYNLLLFSHWVMSDSFVTPWTVAHQAPLSVEFSRQEYWSGLPFFL